ncbi:hypothetical protein [Tatumella sp. OPLPL6]|uniref:hypothetical protein n=1 Tax=Tatumella sp. OPLPL6 TaxID=1928657 RepID=UPI0011803181|nr:hypothetical protein [Tatumella sp. OPLPL6]
MTKLVTPPPVTVDPYEPCRLPNDVPVWMNDYPSYVTLTANKVGQCNERNKAISDHNAALVADRSI